MENAIEAGRWLPAARTLAGVARLLLSLQNRSRETQILSNLAGAVAERPSLADSLEQIAQRGRTAMSADVAAALDLRN